MAFATAAVSLSAFFIVFNLPSPRSAVK